MTNGRDDVSDDEGRDRKVVQAYRAASDVLDERAAPATRAAILAAAARAVDARPRDADEPFVPKPEELRVAASRRMAAAPMAASASMAAKEWTEASAPLQEVARARDTADAAPVRKPALAAARRPLALAASFVVGGVALVVAFNVQRDPSFDDKPSSPLATAAAPASKDTSAAGAAAPADTDKREAPVVAPSGVPGAKAERALAQTEPQRARVAAPEPEADADAARRDGGAAENKIRQQAKKLAESADARVAQGNVPPLAAQAERAPARNEMPAPASRALVLDAPAASPVAPPPPAAAVASPPPKADAQAGAAAASPPAFPASPAAQEPAAARDAIRAKEALSKPALEEQRSARLTGPASAAPDAVGRVRAEPAPPPSMARARPVERTAPIASSERAFESDPARWIERVLTLRAAGSDDEADRELALLRERYPSFDVPAAALRRAGTR